MTPSICNGEDFWNSGLAWTNNSWPQLTECFRYSVLDPMTCIWLWLCSSIYTPYLLSIVRVDEKKSPLFKTRLLFTVGLMVTQVITLVDDTANDRMWAHHLSSAIWLVTLTWSVALLHMEHSRGLTRSIVHYVFWTIGTACLVLQVYTQAMLEIYEDSPLQFVLSSGRFLFSSLLLILSCLSEKRTIYKEMRHNPQISASALSAISFAWIEKLMFKGSRSNLKESDIPELNPDEKTANVIQKFLSKWMDRGDKKPGANSESDAQPKRRPSFFMTLVRTFGLRLFLAQIGLLIFLAMNLVTPFILGFLIEFAEDESEPTWHGYIYVLALLTSRIFITIFNSNCQYMSARMAIRVRSVAVAAIFRKALVLSSGARRQNAMGEIVNLMSVDTNYLELFVFQSFNLWVATLTLIVAIYLLYTVIGISMLAGLCFICLMLVINLRVIANRMKKYQDMIMTIKDERLKMMGEILNGIKVIKLYGWEPLFIRKIKEIRSKELKVLLYYSFADTASTFSHTGATFWMGYFMFMTYAFVSSDHHLDAKTAFVTINYINLIRVASTHLPIITRALVKAATSVVRINTFLQLDDLDPKSLERDKSEKLAARITDGDFAWEPDEPAILSNINLKVKSGQLVAIVGSVGSGKTSVLSALLGEMSKLRGSFNLNSTVAYVPQQAWIQNNTLRENILFGSPFVKHRYMKVVEACALKPDLDILPARDLTEIGEKGINLSGGQKQRVSVARAVYSGADIVLLDDPLSAVDSHVGKHIFQQVISKNGLLKDKTRIMVTHGLQWLPYVDYIVVLSQGTVSEAGTYHKLVKRNGQFAKLLKQYLTESELDDHPTTTDGSIEEEDEEEEEVVEEGKGDETHRNSTSTQLDLLQVPNDHIPLKDVRRSSQQSSRRSSKRRNSVLSLEGKPRRTRRASIQYQMEGWLSEQPTDTETIEISLLITQEDTVQGKVPWSVYYHLLKAYSIPFAVITAIFVTGFHVAYNVTYIWLAEWSDDERLANFTDLPATSSDREDRNRHFLTIYSILGVIQTFCCVLYSGVMQYRHVITSRVIHSQLLESVMRAPMSFFDTTPVGRILNRFSQDLDVLDSELFLVIEVVMEHTMFALGIIVIISYTYLPFIGVLAPLLLLFGVIQRFYVRTSCQLIRTAATQRSPVYAQFSETLSGVSVIRAHQAQERFIEDSERKVDAFQRPMTSYYAANMWIMSRLDVLSYICVVSATIFSIVYRGEVKPGLVGLSVSFALLLTNELAIMTRMAGQLDTQVVAVERMGEYSVLEPEAAWSLKDDKTTLDSWPPKGKIEFIDYSTRYRPGLELVLKKFTVTIEAGQKVGIVGRTGAGKSSLVLGLFRLIEAAGGQILIDGVDIAKVGLHTLRRGLTVLPQDPILFAGTLRMNVDPFQDKTEEELWQALKHAHLKSFVETLPQGLDHDMGEGGESFSMGQRQLLCLARTLVRKTKILVLDEATAAVDMETDELIQKTIHSEFDGCTVLTIAHRINTVLDYDKILVLQNTQMIEFDTPASLLSNRTSVFYSMAKEAHIVD